MAVTTGFQGRTRDVQDPRTDVRRIEFPGTAADAVFADAKAFLSSSEARQMSESELERELHRRGQELIRKLLQEHHDQRSPGETAGPAEDAGGVECSEPCGRESHTETTSRTMQVVRPGCARRHGRHPLDPALNLLPERYLFEMRRVSIATASRAPPRTPWKPTVVLDTIHVAAAMRRAVLVAGSSNDLSACRPRLAVLKLPRAAGALMRTDTFHEAREYPPAVADRTRTVGHRSPSSLP